MGCVDFPPSDDVITMLPTNYAPKTKKETAYDLLYRNDNLANQCNVYEDFNSLSGLVVGYEIVYGTCLAA